MPYLLSKSYFVEEIFAFDVPDEPQNVYVKVMFSSIADGIVGFVFSFSMARELQEWETDRLTWLYFSMCIFSLVNGAYPDMSVGKMSVEALMTNCLNIVQTNGRRAALNIAWTHVLPGSSRTNVVSR